MGLKLSSHTAFNWSMMVKIRPIMGLKLRILWLILETKHVKIRPIMGLKFNPTFRYWGLHLR